MSDQQVNDEAPRIQQPTEAEVLAAYYRLRENESRAHALITHLSTWFRQGICTPLEVLGAVPVAAWLVHNEQIRASMYNTQGHPEVALEFERKEQQQRRTEP